MAAFKSNVTLLLSYPVQGNQISTTLNSPSHTLSLCPNMMGYWEASYSETSKQVKLTTLDTGYVQYILCGGQDGKQMHSV